MKSFTYLRHTFVPLGVLPEGTTFFSATQNCRRIGKGISNYDGGKYSHADFYKKAKEAGCGEIDLFQMDGKITVIPCENELFEYTGKFEFTGETQNA